MNDIPIFNPLNEDFHVYYDVHGNKQPVKFTIKAKSIEYFAPELVDHVKKHLATAMFEKRGNNKQDREMQIAEFLKEMEV